MGWAGKGLELGCGWGTLVGSSKRQEVCSEGAESQRAQAWLSAMTPRHHPETPHGVLAPAQGGHWSFPPCPTWWEPAGRALALVRMRSACLLQRVLAALLPSTEFPWVHPMTSHMGLVPRMGSQHLLPGTAVPQGPELEQVLCCTGWCRVPNTGTLPSWVFLPLLFQPHQLLWHFGAALGGFILTPILPFSQWIKKPKWKTCWTVVFYNICCSKGP